MLNSQKTLKIVLGLFQIDQLKLVLTKTITRNRAINFYCMLKSNESFLVAIIRHIKWKKANKSKTVYVWASMYNIQGKAKMALCWNILILIRKPVNELFKKHQFQLQLFLIKLNNRISRSADSYSLTSGAHSK